MRASAFPISLDWLLSRYMEQGVYERKRGLGAVQSNGEGISAVIVHYCFEHTVDLPYGHTFVLSRIFHLP